ncbi:MAG: radical SAM protein, partial [Acidimicrobiales bacterium]
YLLDVKSPLSLEQAQLLARSGCVALQIGIEALSDHQLRLMQKGNTALQQIQSIRRCTEVGIHPFYAILTHVVGETVADYEEALAHSRAMRHLVAPGGVFPIEINRYAPYFDQWQELGFRRPEPATYYRLMFGPDRTDLADFAYHFTGTHPGTHNPRLDRARDRLRHFVEHDWAPTQRHRRLSYRVGRGLVTVTRGDARSAEVSVRELHGPEADLFLACDEITPARRLVESFSGQLGPDGVRRLLADWVEDGLLVRSHRRDAVLAVPTAEQPMRERAATTLEGSRRRATIPVVAI